MRLMEYAQLRIKDIDCGRLEIVIRQGKGGKDRVTMLPLSLVLPLREQMVKARELYEEGQLACRAGVMLPHALERKYPKTGMQWPWFWSFPSNHESIEPRSGIVRRHHI